MPIPKATIVKGLIARKKPIVAAIPLPPENFK